MPRRIRAASVLLLLSIGPALATPWLTGKDVRTALSGGLFRHADTTKTVLQSFSADGRTYFYDGSQQSEGRWEVRGDKYCALWPPGKAWTCYRVARDSDLLTFVSPNGARYPVIKIN